MFQRFSIVRCWIGLRKGENWNWINREKGANGSILWGRGEPNGNSKKVENCGEIKSGYLGYPKKSSYIGRTTNDEPCSLMHLGLCEKQLQL